MCEFCGCGEPAFQSVTVDLPAIEVPEPDTPEVSIVSDPEDDEVL